MFYMSVFQENFERCKRLEEDGKRLIRNNNRLDGLKRKFESMDYDGELFIFNFIHHNGVKGYFTYNSMNGDIKWFQMML